MHDVAWSVAQALTWMCTVCILLPDQFPSAQSILPTALFSSCCKLRHVGPSDVLEIVHHDSDVHEVPGVDHDLLSDNLCNHQVLLILDLRPRQAHVGPLGRNCKGRRGGGLSPVC